MSASPGLTRSLADSGLSMEINDHSLKRPCLPVLVLANGVAAVVAVARVVLINGDR